MDTFEYPAEVVYAHAAEQRLTAGRIRHIRDLCVSSIRQDRGKAGGGPCALTDRQWLAQSVINILDGKIDVQIADEDAQTVGDGAA